jgi:hypothetical protein
MNLFAGVVLLGVLLAILTVGIWLRKSNVLEILVLGVVYWFCAWVVAGMGLFVLDEFRLFRCGCATLGVITITFVAAVLVRRKRDSVSWQKLIEPEWDIRDYWIPILLCGCGLVLVAVKHGYFGMGQDEGVYQTVAINFMNGLTDRQQDFSEYHLLSEEQQKEFLSYVQKRLVGYDLNPVEYPDTVYDTTVSSVSGIYHGIPTYASILAMWGTLFGMAKMQGVQTLFYCCTIFLVWFTCRNLNLKKSSGFLACVVTAASPIVIWVAKSALTEGFLGVLIILFLFLLTDAAHPERQWTSIVPIAVFGCFHVSIYTMLPLFLVLYGGMYWLTRRKCFAILMPVTVLGYLASFFAMRHVQPFYTMNNYRSIFVAGISQWSLIWLIPLACGIALVACGVYVLLVRKFVHQKYADLTPTAYLEKVKQSRFGFVLVEFLLVLLVVYILLKCLVSGNILATFRNSTFWGYACCSGVFLLAIAWIVGVVKPRLYLESPQKLVILVTAFYCILFYSAFLRFQVDYFYYYGRYLAPYLSVAALFGAITLDCFRCRTTLPVAVAGLVVVAPYDRFLSLMQDDTRMSWDVLEETAGEITENDCVIVDSESMWTLFLPIRAMTGAAMYPVLGGDVTAQAEELSAQYDNVYYIGNGDWTEEFDTRFTLIYENPVEIVTDDNVSGRGKIFPFPLAYQESTESVTLYRYASNRLSYAAADSDTLEFCGFGSLENEFFWSISEDAAVRCQLEQEDYTLTLTMGCMMPLETLGIDTYPVTILINGEEVGTVEVDAENNGDSLSLEVPAQAIAEGENIVTLQCDLWAASLVAEGDGRTLGFPLKALTFQE